jgi:hypothetical protein
MSFGGNLRDFARKTGIRMDTVVRKVCLDMGSQIIKGTPVDTGHARSNWYFGASQTGDTDASTAPSGSPSLGRASAFASNLRAGGVFYIFNNLPYILPLEYGHSKRQAPNGWCRSTVARWQETVNRVVSEVAR